MDIDDILSSVTRAHHSSHGTVRGDAAQQQQDLELLTRAWISERVAPELLPYPVDVIDRTMARLRSQIEMVEDKTSSMDAGTSFALVVLQTELERFKFLIRSLLRTRVAKIDAHPLHVLELHQQRPTSSTLDPGNPLLSTSEAQYVQLHAALLERHYQSSFLAAFPPKLTRLDDRAGAGGVAMIEGPDLDKAVFVRCLGRKKDGTALRNGDRTRLESDDEDEDLEGNDEDDLYDPIQISCAFVQSSATNTQSTLGAEPGPMRATERRVDMRRGEIWIVRWSSVREAVANGECELL